MDDTTGFFSFKMEPEQRAQSILRRFGTDAVEMDRLLARASSGSPLIRQRCVQSARKRLAFYRLARRVC